jgi:putative membrane protein
MTGFLLRAAIVALGLWLATRILDGLHFDGPGVLLAAALLLGIVNAIVRPIAIVLTLPLTLVTLGLFLLVVNAAMLGLVALVLGGFQIDGFWTAVGASLIVSVTSWIASGLIGDSGKVEVMSSKRR